MNSRKMPAIKIISATCSYRSLFFVRLRIERKEKSELAMNNKIATVAISSITVDFDTFSTFSEVSTMKQMPSRLEEAFNI